MNSGEYLKNGIRLGMQAILLIIVGCLIYKYPLTDEKLDQINKEIEGIEKKQNK